MGKLGRLFSFLRPYVPLFMVALVLMALVGAFEALTALLIRPVFDQVLAPTEQVEALPFEIPFSNHAVTLQDFIPSWGNDPWVIVAIAIVFVTVGKGLSEFFGTYSIHYIGQSVVRDLRNSSNSDTTDRFASNHLAAPPQRYIHLVPNR